jgi:hypothetical protein
MKLPFLINIMVNGNLKRVKFMGLNLFEDWGRKLVVMIHAIVDPVESSKSAVVFS